MKNPSDIHELDWLRELFLELDKFADPIMGIRDWDDAVCVETNGTKLIASCDGPYKKRLVMKSALLHAATDVIIKGAKPLFALDTLTGPDREVREMAESLKRQSKYLELPILGGNTMIEYCESTASIFVIGKLETENPIRDSSAKKGDVIAVIGEPFWGTQKERFDRARELLPVWYEIVQKVRINASKDITKGGLMATVREVGEKSGLKPTLIDELPFHRTRNLDNFLITTDKDQYPKIEKICTKGRVSAVKIGEMK